MKKFALEMLTPERSFYEGEAESITVRALDGETELLAGHMPVVIGLKPAMIKINTGDETKICANGEGFCMVEGNVVYIMCQTLEWPEEIEYERVNKAIEEHTQLIKKASNSADYRLSKMTIERALARLRVKQFKDSDKK